MKCFFPTYTKKAHEMSCLLFRSSSSHDRLRGTGQWDPVISYYQSYCLAKKKDTYSNTNAIKAACLTYEFRNIQNINY